MLLRKLDLNWILVILLTVFAFAPLAYPGFFQSHSGLLPIYNLYDLEGRLGDLGWVPTVGRLFDLFQSEGPLPYYLAEVFRGLGASGVGAIKLVYGLSFVLAALTMYGWAKRLLGPRAALLAAVVYTYFPYHLALVYVRGAFAESLAFVLLPAIFWAFHLSAKRSDGEDTSPIRRGINFGYALAGLLLIAALGHTHLGLAVLCVPLLFVYTWAVNRSLQVLGQIFLFLIIPLVVTTALGWGVREEAWVDFHQHFVYLFQLFSATWGYGESAPGWGDTMSFQLGLIPLGLTLLSVMLVARSKEAGGQARYPLILFQVAALVLVLSMLSPTASLWRITGLSRLLTYPWQLLILAALCLSLLAGSVVALDQRLASLPLRAGLVTLAVLASYSYLSPRFFYFDIDFTPQEAKPHFYDMKPLGPPVAILGDNRVALLDYRLEGPLRRGATLRLNVLWQALRPLEEDYAVFVHAVDAEGAIWGQQDTEPKGGEHPTSAWGLGEIIWDRYELRIDVDGPREGYRLEVGMYRPETGERLNVGEDEDKVIIYGR